MFQPNLPADGTALHRFIHSKKVTELSMVFEASVEPRTTATFEFVSSIVSIFIVDSSLRYLELEWCLLDHAARVHHRFMEDMISELFVFFDKGILRLESSEKPCWIYRSQIEDRHVTLLLSTVRYTTGNRSLLLRLFDRQLPLDKDGYLLMDDELRAIVAKLN